jgi:hypothetical protein
LLGERNGCFLHLIFRKSLPKNCCNAKVRKVLDCRNCCNAKVRKVLGCGNCRNAKVRKVLGCGSFLA